MKGGISEHNKIRSKKGEFYKLGHDDLSRNSILQKRRFLQSERIALSAIKKLKTNEWCFMTKFKMNYHVIVLIVEWFEKNTIDIDSIGRLSLTCKQIYSYFANEPFTFDSCNSRMMINALNLVSRNYPIMDAYEEAYLNENKIWGIDNGSNFQNKKLPEAFSFKVYKNRKEETKKRKM